MSAIQMIVGLGNPGPEHETDRHNAGFWFIERIAAQARTTLRAESRFSARVARATVAGGPVWLLQPTTWMNLSGRAIVALANFYRIEPAAILVAHDELDLAPGIARLKWGGGSGGHNGLKDATTALGTDAYWRLRLGIGHPRQLCPGPKDVKDFVLERPSRDQQIAIDAALQRALDVLDLLVSGAIERAAQKLHTQPDLATAPKRPKPPHNGNPDGLDTPGH
ncbi:MAG: aminoacyl-tRNA hydrolase [Betaproteobacteria bacterium]|nr:aminoacyl-tRNA hydrolase [Betaproteobacteria bacterium]